MSPDLGVTVTLFLAMWADLRYAIWKMSDRLDDHLDGVNHGERRKSHVHVD